MQSNTDYISVIHDVFEIINSTGKGKRLLIESNVLNQILTFALDVAMNEDGHLVERQVALAFLVTVWRIKPDFVEGHSGDATYTESIVQALKTGCRDVKSNALRTNSYYLMFSLLFDFAKDKNK